MQQDLMNLVGAGLVKQARAICVRECLESRLQEAPIVADATDLNPHLQVQAVVGQVVKDVQQEGFPECTCEHVYLVWLTDALVPPRPAAAPQMDLMQCCGMDLKDYVGELKEDVLEFETYWRSNRQKEPAKWPAAMDSADWHEQFIMFLSQKDH